MFVFVIYSSSVSWWACPMGWNINVAIYSENDYLTIGSNFTGYCRWQVILALVEAICHYTHQNLNSIFSLSGFLDKNNDLLFRNLKEVSRQLYFRRDSVIYFMFIFINARL